MIGDAEWQDLLRPRYEQHLADSARRGLEPQLFERWAIEVTWVDFVRLARLVETLPPFAIEDWSTSNPVPAGGAPGRSFRSRVLARRLFSALVLVASAMRALRRHRKAQRAVEMYLSSGRVIGGYEFALSRGKRFLYEWLIHQARQEAGARHGVER